MMKRVVTGAAVALLLAGCDSPADPGPAESLADPPSPVSSTVQRATEVALNAVCDALDRALTLPGSCSDLRLVQVGAGGGVVGSGSARWRA